MTEIYSCEWSLIDGKIESIYWLVIDSKSLLNSGVNETLALLGRFVFLEHKAKAVEQNWVIVGRPLDGYG